MSAERSIDRNPAPPDGSSGPVRPSAAESGAQDVQTHAEAADGRTGPREYYRDEHSDGFWLERAAAPADDAHHDCEAAREAQQDPTQDSEEAHPPQHAWRVETRDPLANEWAPGSQFTSRLHAVERYKTATSTAPLWRDGTPVERRIVRETTTYTVEQPAAVVRPGQPETDEETDRA